MTREGSPAPKHSHVRKQKVAFSWLSHPVQALKWAAPSLLTIGALLCGLTAVRFSAEGHFGDCVKCIFFACVLDGLDGHTARALGTSSAIGFELDSLW
jgi:phosphatidylserine synthase